MNKYILYITLILKTQFCLANQETELFISNNSRGLESFISDLPVRLNSTEIESFPPEVKKIEINNNTYYDLDLKNLYIFIEPNNGFNITNIYIPYITNGNKNERSTLIISCPIIETTREIKVSNEIINGKNQKTYTFSYNPPDKIVSEKLIYAGFYYSESNQSSKRQIYKQRSTAASQIELICSQIALIDSKRRFELSQRRLIKKQLLED